MPYYDTRRQSTLSQNQTWTLPTPPPPPADPPSEKKTLKMHVGMRTQRPRQLSTNKLHTHYKHLWNTISSPTNTHKLENWLLLDLFSNELSPRALAEADHPGRRRLYWQYGQTVTTKLSLSISWAASRPFHFVKWGRIKSTMLITSHNCCSKQYKIKVSIFNSKLN